MRLTEKEKDFIVSAVQKNFTDVSCVILFGSRVNDEKRGGDIDLLIETKEANTYVKKIKTLSDIQLKLGEQKIDMIETHGDNDERLIVKNAYKEGIILWKK